MAAPSGSSRQFAVAFDAADLPGGWQTQAIGEIVVGFDPQLSVCEIVAGGRRIGLILGFAIRNGAMIEGQIAFSDAVLASGFDAAIEQELASLDGRYVVIIVTDSMARLYPDPAGSLSTVFSRQRRLCASTASLMAGERDAEVADSLGCPPERNWYPFGLTPFCGIERLLPNHYLDLETFETSRYWPATQIARSMDGSRLAGEIAEGIATNVAAIGARYPLLLSLTAGRDSRMLLACARDLAGTTRFFTRMIDQRASLDRTIAAQLARDFSLHHDVYEYHEADPAELEAWQVQTGYSVAGRWWQSLEAVKSLPQGHIFLPGLMLEVGRGFYWKSTQPEDGVTVELLLQRLNMPNTPLLRDRAQQWLDGLSGMDALQILDLLYLEQRIGCWASPLLYGMKLDGLAMSPVVSRRIFAAMLQLPIDYRREDRMAVEVIEKLWPELLRYPFNPPGPLQLARRLVRSGLQSLRAKFA